jgi:hypothetical protein
VNARERFAWCAFAVTVVALVAAVIVPAHKVSSPAPPGAFVRPAEENPLVRIDARLARLEAAERARRPATAPSASPRPGAAQAAAVTSPEATPAPSDTASIATEQNRLAGTALVERAIVAGYWSRHDAERWRALSPGMRGQDRFGLQRRLITEMNADRLRIEPGALPL